MVLSRKADSHTKAAHTRQSDYSSMSNDVDDGIRAIMELSESGHISKETASDLIKVLYSAYIEALVSQQIEDYFDRDLTHSLLREIEEEISNGGRR